MDNSCRHKIQCIRHVECWNIYARCFWHLTEFKWNLLIQNQFLERYNALTHHKYLLDTFIIKYRYNFDQSAKQLMDLKLIQHITVHIYRLLWQGKPWRNGSKMHVLVLVHVLENEKAGLHQIA